MSQSLPALAAAPIRGLGESGFSFVSGSQMRAQLERCGALDDWRAFAASWNDLAVDTYMAGHGRYRRRRHAVFALTAAGEIQPQAHQPHYQGLEYNPLHGGIARWFEPLRAELAAGSSLTTILDYCREVFGALAPGTRLWHVEVHQFRIEARAGEPGLPTPEGAHRDGVDFVLVLLIARRNIASGTTRILDLQRRLLGSFTLTDPFDAALVDDARVYHGVTAVEALDPAAAAHRDVLVVTFRKKSIETVAGAETERR